LVSWQYFDWSPLEFSQPTVSPSGDEVVVGTSDGHIVGVSTQSGKIAWSAQADGRVDARPVFWEDLILVGDDGGVLHGLSQHGDSRWSYRTRAEIDGTVTVSEGRAFVMDGADVLHALDARTGKGLWTYSRALPDYFTMGGGSQVTVDGDAVYAGFADGTIAALFIEDGSVLWVRDLTHGEKDFVDVDVRPLVYDQKVYVASFSGGIYALDTQAEGALVWHRDTKGASSLLRVGDTLYTTTASRYVIALDAQSGRTKWRFRHAENTPTAAVIDGDYLLYGGSDVGLFVVDRASGRPLLVFDNRTGFSASPTVDGHRVYAMSNRGYLYGFDIVVP
jgi:outer membrane protein assembly factor BamB